ncbi:unnamed protein product [Symbiodinium sp. KB8]|nr:unnamed protein product [Symbiodinium sp. KB8]
MHIVRALAGLCCGRPGGPQASKESLAWGRPLAGRPRCAATVAGRPGSFVCPQVGYSWWERDSPLGHAPRPRLCQEAAKSTPPPFPNLFRGAGRPIGACKMVLGQPEGSNAPCCYRGAVRLHCCVFRTDGTGHRHHQQTELQSLHWSLCFRPLCGVLRVCGSFRRVFPAGADTTPEPLNILKCMSCTYLTS